MAPRAYWKGWLKFAAITCPVRLYAATTKANRISFHQINRKTGHRINLRPHNPETGEELRREDLVKGYEVEKGRFLLMKDEELEELRVTSNKMIEIEEFVPRGEFDCLYLEKPYYLAPDGKPGEQTYALIRQALEEAQSMALGRIVLSRAEHTVVLDPRGKGLLLSTLRPPIDMRAQNEIFADIGEGKLDEEMIDLAGLIMDRRAGHFDPAQFEDRWQVALGELIDAKSKGETLKAPQVRQPAPVVDLKEVLRRSLEAETGKGKPAKASRRKAPGEAARRRKAG